MESIYQEQPKEFIETEKGIREPHHNQILHANPEELTEFARMDANKSSDLEMQGQNIPSFAVQKLTNIHLSSISANVLFSDHGISCFLVGFHVLSRDWVERAADKWTGDLDERPLLNSGPVQADDDDDDDECTVDYVNSPNFISTHSPFIEFSGTNFNIHHNIEKCYERTDEQTDNTILEYGEASIFKSGFEFEELSNMN
ncbi:hypothetical protein GQR58_023622 [Nymphon striatum]|nr:hypothetical protein GQR58_023622 [Nymphon striatum]